MKFKVGSHGFEKGNIIEITDVDDTRALIQNEDTTQVFIVGIEGLEKC